MLKEENNITFILDSTKKIIIETNGSLEKLTCCYNAKVFFYEGNKKIFITKDDVRASLDYFIYILSKAINNNLQLHESIRNDIGILYAQYHFYYLATDKIPDKESNIIFEKNSRDWIGEKYAVWIGEHALWIYNEDNSIILELTPYFKIDDCILEDETPNFYGYKNFIESYKPLLKQVIPKNVAAQWLEKANELIQIIEKNIQKCQNLHEIEK